MLTSFTALHNNKVGLIFFRGIIKPGAGYRTLACSSPEVVQTTGTIAISNEQVASLAWGLPSVPGSINSLPSSQIAPVTRVFISGYSPHRAVVCTTNQWVDPTEVNLVYALSPQAITTIVGRAGGIATDRSENEEPTIRRREVAGSPALLGDCGYIGAYKNGQSNNKASWF